MVLIHDILQLVLSADFGYDYTFLWLNKSRPHPANTYKGLLRQMVICKKWNTEWNGMWNGIWNGIWNTFGLPQTHCKNKRVILTHLRLPELHLYEDAFHEHP